ncbi:outer membrane beta-barrel protein [Litoribacter ruber]|uniref:outer membrane beta-barrel protein n=1 Tax=Litoribacter ruber TaxID=702568 RepID=UPI001BDB2DCC|nr:outer membrane beta-barrel protein [Litoribacter ruber]MBT0812927.1 outer membrane beta-barrel protein [Litoribacter ruber]
MIKKYYFSFAFLLLFSFTSLAQSTIRDHFFIGAGPAMMYADNAGIYSDFKFKVLPNISFGYNYELSNRWDLRATVGNQWISSGEFDPLTSRRVRAWAENDQAINFNGTAIYADLMPVFQLNPNVRGRVGNVVNYYMGAGLGIIHTARQDEFLVDSPSNEGEGMLVEENNNATSLYVPLRFGISTNLEQEWDVAFEGTTMVTTNTNIDGNNVKNKRIRPDMLLQFQVVVRRYIGRY